jgi:hypothetical protein
LGFFFGIAVLPCRFLGDHGPPTKTGKGAGRFKLL